LTGSSKYDATAYDAAYISLCLAGDMSLVTAERTTTAWVAKLPDRVDLVR
jgi:predicted nucleic acid-binding protein